MRDDLSLAASSVTSFVMISSSFLPTTVTVDLLSTPPQWSPCPAPLEAHSTRTQRTRTPQQLWNWALMHCIYLRAGDAAVAVASPERWVTPPPPFGFGLVWCLVAPPPGWSGSIGSQGCTFLGVSETPPTGNKTKKLTTDYFFKNPVGCTR